MNTAAMQPCVRVSLLLPGVTPQHARLAGRRRPADPAREKREDPRLGRNDSAVCDRAKLSESSRPRLDDFHVAASRPWLACETGAMRESAIAPRVPALAAGFPCKSCQASNTQEKAMRNLQAVKALHDDYRRLSAKPAVKSRRIQRKHYIQRESET